MPRDDDWDDVLSQVESALDELGVSSEELREALISGLEEALGDTRPGAEPPSVVVLDGGRVPDPDREEGRPSLEVLEGDGGPRRSATVRVLASTDRAARAGRIDVGPEAWQTVYQGTAHPYRLACSEGELTVALDGLPTLTVGAGQTTDVEAGLVRVRGSGGAARGAYHRL